MEIIKEPISDNLKISEAAAVVIGFLYVTGFYVNSQFQRNLGISRAELLRLDYISIGLTFTLVTFAFVAVPVGAFYLTYNIRRASGLPHLHIGAVGNSLNTILFLSLPIFMSIFATKYEWQLTLSFGHLTSSVQSLFAVYLGVSFAGMALVPWFERLIVRYAAPTNILVFYRALIEPLRYGIVTVSLTLMILIFNGIVWIAAFFRGAAYYFLADVFLVSCVAGAVLWVRHIRGNPRAWVVYPLIAIGLAMFYYMAVSAYVFGIYKIVPENRGGRLPLTRAYLEITGHETLLTGTQPFGGVVLRGPVYIIDENADTLFVATQGMDRWLTDFVRIHAIRKANVPYIRYDRIDDGFPRVIPPRFSGPGGALPIRFLTPTVAVAASAPQPSRGVVPAEFYEARRVFQYDYIYFDALGLLLWLIILLKNREYKALGIGILIAPIIYFIDAHVWWNGSAGSAFPAGTFIREYWIGGIAVQHPAGLLAWRKFGSDFMMTISYALFTFPWLVIVFRSLRNGKLLSAAVAKYTALWVAIWFAVPFLSRFVPWDDTPVVAVRHMNTQFPYWVANVVLAYALLTIVYRRHPAVVLRVLAIGFTSAVVMELPLYVFRIRPTGLRFLLFEGFFLLNQGVPYLWLVFDKIAPLTRRWLRVRSSDSAVPS